MTDEKERIKMKRKVVMALLLLCGTLPMMPVSAEELAPQDPMEGIVYEELDINLWMANPGDNTYLSNVPYEGASYKLLCRVTNGEVTIEGWTENEGSNADDGWNLVIPSTIEGKTVKYIDAGAFRNSSKFTGTVVIPAGIEEIKENTFYGCSNLQGVDFSKATALTTINNGAFYGCSGLGSLTLPANVKIIGASAFSGCTGLTGGLDLSNVTEVYGYAFYNCSGLDGELKLPATVANNSIGEYAFYNCEKLKGEFVQATDDKGNVIPDQWVETGKLRLDKVTGLTEVGAHAFDGCKGFIGELCLPSGITTLGAGAFKNCVSLKSCDTANLKPEDQTFDLSVTSLSKIDAEVFSGCENLTGKLILPAGVTEVGKEAFKECKGLTQLDFSSASFLTKIDDNAFNGCVSLAGNLDLTGTALTTIGASAFKGCDGLTGELKLATTLETIGNSAFEGGKFGSGKDVTATLDFSGLSALTTIGDSAFKDCKSLEGDLDLSSLSSLETIGAGAFMGCDGLTGKLNLAASLKTIGDSAFEGGKFGSGKDVVTNLSFAGMNALETIGNSAFKGCGSVSGSLDLSNLTNLKTIGAEAFTGCGKLDDLHLTGLSALETIGDSAFAGCKDLSGDVLLSASTKLTSIGANAFKGCGKLDALDLSGLSSLKSIGDSAFEGCAALLSSSMNFSASKDLGTIGANAFKGCEGINGPLTIYQLTDNDVKNGKIKGLTSIGDSAFENCHLTGNLELTGAVNLERIGDFAFYVDSPDNGQFDGELKLPDSLTYIGEKAFYENGFGGKDVALKLPASLKEIGEYAFKSQEVARENGYGFSKLDVSAATSLETIGKGAFLHCVFEGELDLSGASNLGTIGDSAFNGCDKLTKVVLPGSLGNTGSGLGEGVFYGCTDLEEMVLQEGMKEVNISNVENYGILKIYDQGVASVRNLPNHSVIYGSADSKAVAYANDPAHKRLVEREDPTQEEVAVSTVDGLLEAVKDGSYKTIVLENGCYILPDTLQIKDQIKLTLRAADGEEGKVEILVEDPEGAVVAVEGSKDVEISGCILGHQKAVDKDAAVGSSVVDVTYSSNVKVNECELWGADAGISYQSVRGLTVNKSVVRDNDRYVVYNQLAIVEQESQSNGVDVKFTECTINANGEKMGNQFDIFGAEEITFEKCIFLNNYGSTFVGDNNTEKDCDYYNNLWGANQGTPQKSGICLNGVTWYVKDDVISIGYPLVMNNGTVYTTEKKDGEAQVLPYSEYALPWAESKAEPSVKELYSEDVKPGDKNPEKTTENIQMVGDLTVINGKYYFYEDGVMAKSKEAFVNDAWRWFDADGTMAVSKDVYQPSNGGKWVRYNADGEMVKGQDGDYYFEEITGAMVKGPWTLEDGRKVFYDTVTGVMVKGEYVVYNKPSNVEGVIVDQNHTEENATGVRYFFAPDGSLVSGPDTMFWVYIDGREYWYEDWQRQGWDPANPAYRGKEIYDPESDAWYWLDNVQSGAKAVGKDVYQESLSAYPDREDGTGKWVRYDKDGKMIKGWHTTASGKYYFEEVTGAMAKGKVTIEGTEYEFDEVTGILKQ